MPVPDSDWPIVLPAGATEWDDEEMRTVPDAGVTETRALIENGWPR